MGCKAMMNYPWRHFVLLHLRQTEKFLYSQTTYITLQSIQQNQNSHWRNVDLGQLSCLIYQITLTPFFW